MEYARTANQVSTLKDRPISGAVDEHSSEMDRQLEGCHQAFDEIINRFQAVLKPVPPAGTATGSSVPTPITSPLGEKLRGQVVALAALRQRMVELLDRADL